MSIDRELRGDGQPPRPAGQIEYEASASLVTGEELPAWDDLSSSAKEAWESAGQAVIDSTVPERAS